MKGPPFLESLRVIFDFFRGRSQERLFWAILGSGGSPGPPGFYERLYSFPKAAKKSEIFRFFIFFRPPKRIQGLKGARGAPLRLLGSLGLLGWRWGRLQRLKGSNIVLDSLRGPEKNEKSENFRFFRCLWKRAQSLVEARRARGPTRAQNSPK